MRGTITTASTSCGIVALALLAHEYPALWADDAVVGLMIAWMFMMLSTLCMWGIETSEPPNETLFILWLFLSFLGTGFALMNLAIVAYNYIGQFTDPVVIVVLAAGCISLSAVAYTAMK